MLETGSDWTDPWARIGCEYGSNSRPKAAELITGVRSGLGKGEGRGMENLAKCRRPPLGLFVRSLRLVVLIGLLAGPPAMAEPAVLKHGGESGSGTEGYDVSRLLEIRPAGGSVVAPGADLMPQTLVDRIRKVPYVVKVEAYLFVGLVDTTQGHSFAIIGGTVPEATFRVNCHNVEAVRIVEGRGLRADDVGQRVAIVGTLYAETYAPPGERRISVGGTIELVRPGIESRGLRLPPEAKVQVVGVFSSGFRLGDSQVLLPLDTAQKLFGLEGKVSKLFVTVDAPGVREQVVEALRVLLGEDVDVVYPRRGGMR